MPVHLVGAQRVEFQFAEAKEEREKKNTKKKVGHHTPVDRQGVCGLVAGIKDGGVCARFGTRSA